MDTSPSTTKPDPKKRQTRKQRLAAPLDRDRRVLTEGVDSTMEAYLAAIGELYRRGMAAHRQKIGLPSFLSILHDQAGR